MSWLLFHVEVVYFNLYIKKFASLNETRLLNIYIYISVVGYSLGEHV